MVTGMSGMVTDRYIGGGVGKAHAMYHQKSLHSCTVFFLSHFFELSDVFHNQS